ncbi:MAG: sigma-70 family RNA polymerase sigma factor [Phycisphaerales bacterium]
MTEDAPHPDADAPEDRRARSLTDAVVSGDREAYAQLFRLRCDFVEECAARALRHRRDLAPDAAQEAWIRVARAPVRCPCAAALDAWLRRVATTAAIDLLRSELARRVREQRVARTRGEACAFVDDAGALAQARAELEALAQLAPGDRALLELRARAGGTVSQLAAALGIGAAAIDSRLRRATERARRALEGATP